MRDFVLYAVFSGGKGAVEKSVLQNANRAGVKAVEAPDFADCRGESFRGHLSVPPEYLPVSTIIVDISKYINVCPEVSGLPTVVYDKSRLIGLCANLLGLKWALGVWHEGGDFG